MEEPVIWLLIVTMSIVGLAWVKIRRRRKAMHA
jgi:LPXTG-motif cell wall-anchored protein